MVLCQKHFQNKKDTRCAVFFGTGARGGLAPPGSATDTNSLDFAINRFLMKLFNNINIIEECRVNFGVILPSSLITSSC